MSVTPVATETAYALSGATLGPFNTVWPYNFASDVTVQLDRADGAGPQLLAQGADYTLTALAPTLSNGGAVTLASHVLTTPAWNAGALVALVRITPRSQPSIFGEAVGFSPQASEQALDNVERQVQELTAQMGRALLSEPGGPVLRAPLGPHMLWANDGTGLLAGVPEPTGPQALWTNDPSGVLTGFGYGGQPNKLIGTDPSGALALLPPPVSGAVGTAPVFQKVGDVASAYVDAGANAIETQGYYAVGDGGGALYVRTPTPGAAPGKVQSADGAWWQVVSAAFVNVRQYGAKGDGVADDCACLQGAVNDAVAQGKPLYVPAAPVAYLLKTLVMNGTVAGTPYPAFCLIPTGGADFTMFGDGEQSVFTIPNAFLGGATNYNYFVSADDNTHGRIEVSGIRINGNGFNNPVSAASLIAAYALKILTAVEIYVHDCIFDAMPGTNVLNFSNYSYATTTAVVQSRIVDNLFRDVGGAIPGNEKQSDHSTTYVQAQRSLLKGNVCYNTNVNFNPNTAPARTLMCFEEHSVEALAVGNVVVNYGGAVNTGTAYIAAKSQSWVGNLFLGMKANILNIYALAGGTIDRVLIENNVFEADNVTAGNLGGTAILENPASMGASPRQIIIRGNSFYCLNNVPIARVANGVTLCAGDSIDIQGNEFSNWTGTGILFISSTIAALNISQALIDNNRFRNCGMGTVGSSVWAIWINNTDTTRGIVFRNITIGPDNFVSADFQPVGSASWPCRGYMVQGPGQTVNVTVHTPRISGAISRGVLRVQFSSTANFRNCVQVPRTVMLAKAAQPISGYFEAGGEMILHTDPAPGYSTGRIPTSPGSASESVWAPSTAYVVGQWIRTSAGRVLECTVAGTSDPATEPAPATTFQQYVDGTVTWFYREIVSPVFANYGSAPIVATATIDIPSIPATSNGTEQSITATGALAGATAVVIPNGTLGGVNVSNVYVAAGSVKFTPSNPTTAAIDPASRTFTVKVWND